jgi:hypothetical protein
MSPRPRFLGSRSFARSLALLFTGVSFLAACASAPATSTKKKRTPVEPGDEFYADDPPAEQGLSPTSNPDSGAFSPAAERPAPPPAPDKDAGGTHVDAGAGDGGVVQPKVFCTGALAAGDLVVSEILINSRAGSGDDGEWIEIKNARTCWLDVKGLSIESPRGTTGTNAVTITENWELGPGATFVVADSADPAKNHGLPGKVFAWGAADVLKNDGDTVALKAGAVVVDTLTYPGFSNLEAGRTLAFPSDCPGNVRGDWARWSLTFDVYTAGFKGTPNAANDDVACY